MAVREDWQDNIGQLCNAFYLNGLGAAINAKYELPIAGLPTADLADNSVTNAKMADDSVGIAELSATGTPSASTFLCGNNTWVTGTIPDDSVNNSKMADDAVGLAELSATGTPSASTFLCGNNTWAAPTVGTVDDNSITLAKMADDSVGIAELTAAGSPSSSVFLRGDNTWATPGVTPAGVIIPEDYGAVGNDSADDTTAMQNWLNAVTAAPGHRKGQLTGGKTYRITSELTISSTASHQWHIEGNGATIKQATTNLAIIRFTVDNMYSCSLRNITFDYASQQGTASGKAAVCFDCTPGVTGWRMFLFENLVFNRCYRGLQTLDTGNINKVWGSEFRNIIGNSGMTGTLISLRSPTRMANNSFDHIHQVRDSATEPVLNLYQNFNVSISNLETNQSTLGGTEILLEGCYNATLTNIRTENGTSTAGNSLYLFVLCKAVSIDGWQVQNRTFPSATVNVFECQNNSMISVGPGMITQYDQAAAGANLRVLLLDSTSKCTRYEQVIRPSGVLDGVSALTTGTYTMGTDRVVTIQVLPPSVVAGSVNGTPTSLTLWTGTAAQYTAVSPKVSTTVYVVTA